MRNYNDYSHGRSVGWNEYHFQWCTKYRYKIFRNLKYKNFCKILIEESCKRYSINLIEYEVDSNHIHLLVSLPLTMTPIEAISKIKGYTSKCLFILCPKLRSLYHRGHLWSSGKFIASVDHITLSKAKEYIEKHEFK